MRSWKRLSVNLRICTKTTKTANVFSKALRLMSVAASRALHHSSSPSSTNNPNQASTPQRNFFPCAQKDRIKLLRNSYNFLHSLSTWYKVLCRLSTWYNLPRSLQHPPTSPRQHCQARPPTPRRQHHQRASLKQEEQHHSCGCTTLVQSRQTASADDTTVARLRPNDSSMRRGRLLLRSGCSCPQWPVTSGK